MTTPDPAAAAVLGRKLQSIAVLAPEDLHALQTVPMTIREVPPGHDFVTEGDRPTHSCLIIKGFVSRHKVTWDGKRQIHSFHIAGDMPDLQSLHLRVMDHNVGALNLCKIAFIPHDSLRELCSRFPRIGAAFWRDTLIDAAVFREWITNVGRRTAYERMAHLFCEVYSRSKSVGVAEGDRFEFPVTQATLGDATGLSTVHVNRTLQELRAAGLIRMEDGAVTVLDWERLKQAGRFDPGYLHLQHEMAA